MNVQVLHFKIILLIICAGEVYNEKWLATPFTVRVKNMSYPGPVEAQCFVDGRLAAIQVVNRGGVGHIVGFQSQPKLVAYKKDTITEFLFTLPRMMRRGEEQKPSAMNLEAKAALETIRVEFYDVEFSGETHQVHVQTATAPALVLGVNKAVAHGAKTSSATASGAQLATGVVGSYKAKGYNRVDKISEIVIRYGEVV